MAAAHGSGQRVHPDFGPSYGDGPDYGIPITVVDGDHRKVSVRFMYAGESDRVRYPLGRDTRIEGGRRSDGDRHAIVVDRRVPALRDLVDPVAGRPVARRVGCGLEPAVQPAPPPRLDVRRRRRPPDPAGSAPMAPRSATTTIDHAIRFTTDETSTHHLWPARHDAGSHAYLGLPPMERGSAWTRLQHDGYGRYARRVIRAMQIYGLVLADNGSPWFFQGEQHRRWPGRLIEVLKQIPAALSRRSTPPAPGRPRQRRGRLIALFMGYRPFDGGEGPFWGPSMTAADRAAGHPHAPQEAKFR